MKSFGFKTNELAKNTVILVLVVVISYILWNKFGSNGQYYETLEQMKKKPAPANMNNPVKEYQPITNSNQLLPKDTNSEWNNLNPSGT